MSLTAYHVKYFAHDLTRRSVSGIDRLSMALFDASVDLNPHQIEAALFAWQSPLSKMRFQGQYVNAGTSINDLRQRLSTFCKRTLRNQVTEFIRYTECRTFTRPFSPSDDEHALYEAVSAFLQRADGYALPQRQQHLTSLILRKLLASSSLAIAGTLNTLRLRLEALRDGQANDPETMEKLFACGARLDSQAISQKFEERLDAEIERHAKATFSRSLEQNSVHFNKAREKLEKWADDMVLSAEKALFNTKGQIKAHCRQSRQAVTLEEQHVILEKIQKLERQQRRQRQEIFAVEDEIMVKLDALIESLERRLAQQTKTETLFSIRWTVQ